MDSFASPNLLNLEPYIQCHSLWHPVIQDDRVVTNDITLDDPRNMIITGPNAGKSTFIKSITLSLVFSDTWNFNGNQYEINTI